MKRNASFKLLAIVLVYTNLLWPMAILAETTKAAGVVATLKGQVLVTSAALPQQSRPLNFKDEVFFKDRITTKEESLVRVLMGGKALVTVRELSELTITEEPGKPSIVDIAKGKIGLAVAKARMNPGESIEVRTPNAVAAIRGTVIVVEVIPVAGAAETAPDYRPVRTSFTGQAMPVQAPSFMTNFHVLKGSIGVTSLAQPGSAPVSIGAGLSVSVVGGTVGQPQTSPPLQQLVKGLTPPSQHVGTPPETNNAIANQQMNTASNLATIITGGTPIPNTVYNTTSQNFLDPKNVTNSATGGGTTHSTGSSDAAGGGGSSSSGGPISTTNVTIPPPIVNALGVPLVTFSGFTSDSIALSNTPLGLIEAGAATVPPTPLSLASPDPVGPEVMVSLIGGGQTPGQVIAPGSPGEITTPYYATALVTSNDSRDRETVLLTGGIGLTDSHVAGGSNNIFQVSGVDAVIGGSALILQNSSITTTGNVIDITSASVSCGVDCGFTSLGSLTGISSDALVTVDGTSSISANRLVSIGDGQGTLGDGGFGNGLVLVGPVLAANGSSSDIVNVNVTGDLIYVGQNGFLGVASSLPLLDLSTSNLHADRLLNISSSGTVILGGSLLLAQDSDVSLKHEVINVSGHFTTDSTLPVVSLTGGTLQYCTLGCGGTFMDVNNGAGVDLKGGLLSVSNGTVSGDGVVSVFSGGMLTTGTAAIPLVSVNSSTLSTLASCCNGEIMQVNGGTAHLAGSLLEVSGRLSTESPSVSTYRIADVSNLGTLSVGGSVLKVTNSALAEVTDVSVSDYVIYLGNTGTLNTSTVAAVSLQNSALSAYGLIDIDSTDSAVLGGSLLSASGSRISFSGDMIVIDGGSLTTTGTTQSLVQLTNGSLTLGGGLLNASNGAHINLSGGLFQASGTTLTPSSKGALVTLNNASLTAGGSLMDLTNSALDLGANPVAYLSGSTPSILTVNNGPVFKVSGGSLTADALIKTDIAANTFNLTGSLLDLTNTLVSLRVIADTPPDDVNITHFTLGSGQPFIRMTNSTLLMSGSDNLVDFGNGSGTAPTQGGVALIATSASGAMQVLSLGGTLLHLKNVIMTDTNPQVQLTNMIVTQSGTTAGLIRVSSPAPGQAATLSGPLLSATGSSITVSEMLDVSGELTTTSPTLPLMSVTNGTITASSALIFVGGPDGSLTSQSSSALMVLNTSPLMVGGNFLGMSGCCGASVSLAGPLLTATTSPIMNAGDFIYLTDGADLTTSTAPAALVGLTNSPLTVNGSFVRIIDDSDNGSGSMMLAGPMLSATNSPIAITSDFIYLANDADLTSTTTAALVTLSNSPLLVDGAFVHLASSGTNLYLAGPLLSATNSPLALRDGLVVTEPGSHIILTGATPFTLVTLTGGVYNIDKDGGGSAMFQFTGNGSTDQPISRDDGEASGLPLGAPLLTTSGAIVNSRQALSLDSALLGASAPLFNFAGSSVVATASDFVNLSGANLTGTLSASDALVKLNQSTLTVRGSLFNVTNGSALNVTGNLFSLDNSSRLNILGGALVTVSGGSTFSLTGSFGTFGSNGTNALNLPTTTAGLLNCSGCSLVTSGFSGTGSLGGFAVALGPGASASQITINSGFVPFVGPNAGNSVTAVGILLVVMDDGSTVTLSAGSGTAMTSTAAANIESMHLQVVNAGTTTTLSSPVLTASNKTVTLLGDPNGSQVIFVQPGATLTASAVSGALVSLTNSPLSSDGTFLSVVAFSSGSPSSATTVTLGGPLLTASGSPIIITRGDVISMGAASIEDDGGPPSATISLSSATTSPLITLTNSPLTNTDGGVLHLSSSATSNCCDNASSSVTMTLHGSLISATNSPISLNFNLIDSTADASANSGDVVNASVSLTNTTTSPLVSLTNSLVVANGSLLNLSSNGTISTSDPGNTATITANMTLKGPLLSATASPLVFNGSGFFSDIIQVFAAVFTGSCDTCPSVTVGGTLMTATSTFDSHLNTAPLVSLTTSPLTSTGENGNFLHLSANTSDCCGATIDGGVVDNGVASVSMTVGGALLSANASPITLGNTVLAVNAGTGQDGGGGHFTSASATTTFDSSLTTSPLVSLTASPLSAQGGFLALAAYTSTCCDSMTATASMTLAGPLLSASNSPIILTDNVLGVFVNDGSTTAAGIATATLTSTTTSPLVTLTNSPLTAAGAFLSINGCDGCPGTSSAHVSLAGPLLAATSSNLALAGGLIGISPGGTLTTSSSLPLVSLSGGAHAIASASGAMFDLRGIAVAPFDTGVDNGDGGTVVLSLGTDRPIRGNDGEGGPLPVAAPLFQATNATVTTNQAVSIDTALLEATAPLIKLVSSTMNSNSDFIKLVNAAQVNVNVPSDALISMNASMLNVNGSLFNVAGGSFLNVTGNLFSLSNGSTLNINGAALITVSGSSVFSLSGGSIGLFGTGTNTLNITNTVALCSGCTLTTTIPNLAGVPVLLGNGVSPSQISVSSGFVALAGLGGSNTVHYTGPSAALIALNGTGRIKLRP